MSLSQYRKKRDFKASREPPPDAATKRPLRKGARRFVIQKHAASHLHYDFRLEIGGVLKSWACPKGVPYQKGEKRLAVMVEDHPLAYGDFEGTIPEGEYGGGTVMLWDEGRFEPTTPLKGLAEGKLHFVLHGEKLKGAWYLIRLKKSVKEWLLIKGGASMKAVGPRLDNRSVASGRTMKQIAEAARNTLGGSAPAFVEPMKAKLASHPPRHGEWLYEIKFDGWRAMALLGAGAVQLLSRNEKDLTQKFPEIVAALARLPVESASLDGEIVALDKEGRSSFQLMQARERGLGGEGRPPIFFYAFDLVELNGRDLRGVPLEERRTMLEGVLRGAREPLRYSASLGSNGSELLAKAEEWQLEGVIGKRLGSRYEAGKRSGQWVKLKALKGQEFVIGGYTAPKGGRRHFGALLLGVMTREGRFVYAGKVGTGFDAAWLERLAKEMAPLRVKGPPFYDIATGEKRLTRRELKECHWVTPRLVCQVKFAEWTRDGRLRQPVFLGLRGDKEPKEVQREEGG